MLSRGKINKPSISSYYKDRTRKDREESSLAGLREFHNKFVKKQLISGFHQDDGIDKNLLDLSCGQGGDIWRWGEVKGPNSNNTLNSVLGIDISKNNIYSVNGGALDRLMNFKKLAKVKKYQILHLYGVILLIIYLMEILQQMIQKKKNYSITSLKILMEVFRVRFLMQ